MGGRQNDLIPEDCEETKMEFCVRIFIATIESLNKGHVR